MSTSLPASKLVSVRELAAFSGECASTWRRRIRRRELPSLKLGKNVRLRAADVDRWLRSRQVKTDARAI